MIPFDKPKYWLPFLLFLIIGFIIINVVMDKKNDDKYGKFKEISNNTIIAATITKIERDSRGFTYVALNTNKYYWLSWAINYNYSTFEIYDFLKTGDSLSKIEGSDTIFVYRDGKQYVFKFNNAIQKK